MTDEPTPEPEEPAAKAAPEGPPEGEDVLRRPFLLHFPRAPIPGTELTIRSPSVGQDSETWADLANEGLDDREFTVRLVHRQLDQDQPIEEVRAWPNEQLLAAAEAYLSLDTTEPYLDDEETPEGEVAPADRVDEDQAADETDGSESGPLTLAGFRDQIRQQGLRQAKRTKRTMSGILALSDSNTRKLVELMKVDPTIMKGLMGANIFKGLDLTKLKEPAGANIFRGVDVTKFKGLAGASIFKGINLTKFGALSDTSKIGEGLSKMLADTKAMEKFVRPPMELRVPRTDPIRMPYPGTIARPEVRLLEGVGETLEKMHDDQARTAEDQIDVMVQQTALLKDQGVALTALVSDAKSQKWYRRAMLVATILAAGAAVAAALYAGGVIRPFGAAAPVTPAPIVSPSPTSSPTLVPTP